MTAQRNLTLDRYDFAAAEVEGILGAEKTITVFDVGAGDSRFARLRSDSVHYFGFDRESWGEVRQWDLSTPCPVAASADVVLLLDVIEHLPNPGLALRHIADALRPGGRLILTTPNPRWSGSRVNHLIRGDLGGFSKHDLDENYHVLPIWPHVLERFLLEVRLKVNKYVTLDGRASLFGAPGRLRGPLLYLRNLCQLEMEARDISAQGMSYGVVAEKTTDSLPILSYPGHA